MDHEHDPAKAPEFEIIGKPTMLARFDGRIDAGQILDILGTIGYPVDDVSVLFRPHGGDEVIDLVTGEAPAGQAISEQDLKPKQWAKGQTDVLLHPQPEQVEAVRQALTKAGSTRIDYAAETHAYGRPGGMERVDEGDDPGRPADYEGPKGPTS